MSKPPTFPPPVHVQNPSSCPNPLCNIRASHEFHHLIPIPAIPVGVQQLKIARFPHPSPFPMVNCWKLVSPAAFDPEEESWAYLSDGYGTVGLMKTPIEREGWVLYDAERWEIESPPLPSMRSID
ncbi:uncharacterized protein LACBIDRAFT_326069 [Laccaria bicolor S238N-H82]|uniref:Predicted protein n=1 Tax=Laccaria bicolor (strain S238N-H82 / ATCC MYA-4686) TaxID=486041 RepID=B0D771_LACBS|nr:uncharacterized protein LACBIDRAFT_326069 [Laccaria bicolor S238N-H82]EDR09346.1 predicted protein [Laccaria bicolor S238N-H82]|eukprot:XP_001879695.1 predicted protein [Laccaria bicolor S238N-H82]